MNAPIISFILPVYNCSQGLVRCVRSIAECQVDWELIIIDDASTDDTLVVCEQFLARYPDVKILHQLQNTGPGKARNAGIGVARGKWLFFVDSDDRIVKFNEKILPADKADIVLMNYMVYDGNHTRAVNNVDQSEYLSVGEFCTRHNNFFISTMWMWLFKRDFIIENHITVPELYVGEDIVFVAECLARSKCIFTLPSSFYCYSQIPDAKSLTKSVSLEERCMSIEYFDCRVMSIIKNVERTILSFFERQRNKLFLYALSSMKNIPLINSDTIRSSKCNSYEDDKYPVDVHEVIAYYKRIRSHIENKLNGFENSRLYMAPAGALAVRFGRLLIKNGLHIEGFIDTYKAGKLISSGFEFGETYQIPCVDFDVPVQMGGHPIVLLICLNSQGQILKKKITEHNINEDQILVIP